MSKKLNVLYEDCRNYVANKDEVVLAFINSMLSRTAQMFKYSGLPDTIPERELELQLQCNGECFIAEFNGNLYAFEGSAGGELDEYYRPTIYTVANPALHLSREFRIGVDGIRVLNDTQHTGILPILKKYAALNCDAVLSFDTAVVLARISMLINAPDDKSKASAEQFVNKILNGDFSIIGDNQMFDGIRLQTAADSTNRLQQLIESIQYIKGSCYNELGIGESWNMKRERLNVAEVEQTNSGLIPLVYDMYQNRVRYFDMVNNMFGTNIQVEFSSVWVNDDNIIDENSINDSSMIDNTEKPIITNQENEPDGGGIENDQN